MEVRDATTRDIIAVQRVARISWADAYRDIVPNDVQERFLEHAYSEESLKSRVSSGVFVVAEADGEVVGFADFCEVSADEVELAAIYVLPGFQRRGIGSRLFDEGLRRLPSASKRRVAVERENERARRFYESRGFAKTGERTERAFGHDFHETLMLLER